MNFTVKDDEVLENLGIQDLTIIQKKEGFRFGTDAVLLAQFACPKKGDKIVDLCSGSGILPLLFSCSDTAEITGIEINPELVDMAARSAEINKKTDRIRFITGDVSIPDYKLTPKANYDLVTCNPPYSRKDSGIGCADPMTNAARFEVLCTLKDVIRTGAELLRFGGRFCIVHRPERAGEVIYLMKAFSLEAKQMTLVNTKGKEEPSLVLIEGRKNGNPGMRINIQYI